MHGRGASNTFSQHTLLWRTGENYPRIIIKYASWMSSVFHIPLYIYIYDCFCRRNHILFSFSGEATQKSIVSLLKRWLKGKNLLPKGAKKFRYISYFSTKTYVVGSLWKCLTHAFLMGTLDVCFIWEIRTMAFLVDTFPWYLLRTLSMILSYV